jgi:DNA-binding NarL/FixJ family response regulator
VLSFPGKATSLFSLCDAGHIPKRILGGIFIGPVLFVADSGGGTICVTQYPPYDAQSLEPLTIRKGTHMNSVSVCNTGPRFLIADDHAVFAEALRVYLEKRFRVVGVVMNGRAMVTEAMRLRPDVIVVDVSMPLLNGLDAAREIAKQLHNIKFVFLTMRDDPNLAAAALELGPIGFVLKHSLGQELLKAIDYVLHCKPYLTPKLRAEDWVATKARARQFSTAMTPRQRSSVQLLAEGRLTKQIADVLNISEKTVEFHKHHIREAFNLRSNADVVLFALKEGLISTNP